MTLSPQEQTLMDAAKRQLIDALKAGKSLISMKHYWDDWDYDTAYYLDDNELTNPFILMAFDELYLDDVIVEKPKETEWRAEYILNTDKLEAV